MSSNEKIDVIDLIINVLREHEKTLDTLISKLETTIESAPKKDNENVKQVLYNNKYSIIVNTWSEFKERSSKADLAVFSMKDNKVKISVIKENFVYSYVESVSEITMTIEKINEKILVKGLELSKIEDHPLVFNGRLKCGLTLTDRKSEFKLPDGNIIQKINYEADNGETKNWLAKQLEIKRENIIIGEIEI
ncbi:MAG: hypothetical protein NTY03_16150 [Candidatus Bathyarchaeota archaeon]|nr:hypothetical protein [Candidatus Bathyarchaeota archaeon]